MLRLTRAARKKLRPRHERVIVHILTVSRVCPRIVLPEAILSVWQIEENRFGNVLLIIVNGFFTVIALALGSGMNALLCGQQCGQSGAARPRFAAPPILEQGVARGGGRAERHDRIERTARDRAQLARFGDR